MGWTKRVHFSNSLPLESHQFSKDFPCQLQKGNSNRKSQIILDKTLFPEEDQVALFQKFIQTLINNWKKQVKDEKKF